MESSESPEINIYIYGHSIFTIFKDAKTIQYGKSNLFNKWCWDSWLSTCKWIKLDAYLTPYTKTNSKWIKDLNARANTIKLLDKNIKVNLSGLGWDNGFLDMKSKAHATKEKINWMSLNFKTFVLPRTP